MILLQHISILISIIGLVLLAVDTYIQQRDSVGPGKINGIALLMQLIAIGITAYTHEKLNWFTVTIIIGLIVCKITSERI